MIRIKSGIVIALAASLGLAGCAAMEDFASNPDKGKTRAGTGYGAAAGAVVGLLTAGNNPMKSAMIGAAAGAWWAEPRAITWTSKRRRSGNRWPGPASMSYVKATTSS